VGRRSRERARGARQALVGLVGGAPAVRWRSSAVAGAPPSCLLRRRVDRRIERTAARRGPVATTPARCTAPLGAAPPQPTTPLACGATVRQHAHGDPRAKPARRQPARRSAPDRPVAGRRPEREAGSVAGHAAPAPARHRAVQLPRRQTGSIIPEASGMPAARPRHSRSRKDRRRQTLRRWSAETADEARAGGAGAGRAEGPRPPGRARPVTSANVVGSRVQPSGSSLRLPWVAWRGDRPLARSWRCQPWPRPAWHGAGAAARRRLRAEQPRCGG
jgi:hypothetical protein